VKLCNWRIDIIEDDTYFTAQGDAIIIEKIPGLN
jgi:hypothetical protein